MNTHKFNLCSGPECEVKEMTGKHQRILTEQEKKSHNDKLHEILEDLIVRVGSVHFPVMEGSKDVTSKFLKEMLACDKKKILTEIRQFSLDFQTDFSFLYKYQDSTGKKQETEIVVNLEEEVGSQFPSHSPKNEIGGELSDLQFEEYSEVLEYKKVRTILPKSGEEVEFIMLDGVGEAIGSATKKSERSSHTLIKMRRPVKFVQKSEGRDVVPVQLNLDNLSIADIEHLRKKIKEVEGNVDTEIIFEHPDGDLAPNGEREVILDLLSTAAFFFPSAAI